MKYIELPFKMWYVLGGRNVSGAKGRKEKKQAAARDRSTDEKQIILYTIFNLCRRRGFCFICERRIYRRGRLVGEFNDQHCLLNHHRYFIYHIGHQLQPSKLYYG